MLSSAAASTGHTPMFYAPPERLISTCCRPTCLLSDKIPDTAMAKSRQPLQGHFRFRDLPVDIQLKIFQIFMPPGTPIPAAENFLERMDDSEYEDSDRPDIDTDASSTFSQQTCGSGDLQRVLPTSYSKQAPSDYANSKDAFNLLRLDKATFKDFAPHYYQYRNLVFTDPTNFANEFLANATNACLYNLRYISCVIDEGGLYPHPPLSSLKKLAEVISTWKELQYLYRFELIWSPSTALRYMLGGLGGRKDLDMSDRLALWNYIDQAAGRKLSAFIRQVQRKTFRGFEVQRGLCFESEFDVRSISMAYQEVSVTFSREP